MIRFALDEDFPDTIINALGLGVPEADLVPILAQNRNHDDPWDELQKIANHKSMNVKDLFQTHKLSSNELTQNPLADQRSGR